MFLSPGQGITLQAFGCSPSFPLLLSPQALLLYDWRCFLSILSCSFTFQKAGKIYVLGYWFPQGLLAFFSTKAYLIKEHHIDLIKGSNSQNWFCSIPSRMGLNLDSVQNGGWKVPKACLFVTCHHLPKPPGGRLRKAACLSTMFL